MRALVFVATLGLGLLAVQAAPMASAQQTAPAAAPAAVSGAVDAPAGQYRSDPRHTSVLFRIQHEHLSWFTARFDTSAATLTFDPADPTHSVLDATVQAGSVNTNVLNSQGERAFDAQIGRALGSEAHPQITFHSTAIERDGNAGRITGDLTMNGEVHPMTLDVTFQGAHLDVLRGHTVLGFSAHGTLQRSQWKVDNWRQFAGDDVQLVIETEFVKD